MPNPEPRRSGLATGALLGATLLLALATVIVTIVPLADCPICSSNLDVDWSFDPCRGRKKVTLLQKWRIGHVTVTLDEP